MVAMPSRYRVAPTVTEPAPRTVSESARRDLASHGRFLRLFGAIWGGVGFGLAVLFALLGATIVAGMTLGAGIGAVFGVAGAVLWTIGWWQRAIATRAYRDGIEVRGEVVDVFLDHRVRVNRQHPWRVVFRFQVDGKTKEDTATYWDLLPPRIDKGDPVVVLHTPARSVLWTQFERGDGAPARVRVASEPVRIEGAPKPVLVEEQVEAVAEDVVAGKQRTTGG